MVIVFLATFIVLEHLLDVDFFFFMRPLFSVEILNVGSNKRDRGKSWFNCENLFGLLIGVALNEKALFWRWCRAFLMILKPY